MSAAAAANMPSAARLGMAVSRTIAAMRSARRAMPPDAKVGFVPTMGALHDGEFSPYPQPKRMLLFEVRQILFCSLFNHLLPP